MDSKFTVSASPHIAGRLDTPKVMYEVSAALLPASVASVVFFGWRAVALIVACVSSSVLAEALFRRLRDRKVSIGDGSAVLTGLLLALVVPPDLPVWMAILASVFAIGIGKEIFGGLGYNIFNPALLGRAFLSAAFPSAMTVYRPPFTGFSYAAAGGVDGVTSATPLALMKFEGVALNLRDLFIGNVSGSLGETSALLLLLGGAYILIKGYADWRIPLSFIGTVFVFGHIMHIVSPGEYPTGLFHILAGGLMIGALFMATDPVTSPVTKSGRLVFGMGCGILVVIIRLWGGQPEGVMYAILFMNVLTPVVNILTKPKRYGT